MNSRGKLKDEMEAIQLKIVEAQHRGCANALKEVMRFCKEFGFVAGMIVG